jgi:hypothetical protein
MKWIGKPMFRGIFRIWFGGKRDARLSSIRARKVEAPDQEDDNLPGVDDPTGEGSRSPDPTGPNRPVLAFDRDDEGVIDPASELAFLQDAPDTTTNFDALKSFDANGDDVFDVNDPQFQRFGVWTDDNQNGQFETGEFKTLDQMNIESIDLSKGLSGDALSIKRFDGSEGLLKLTTTSSVTL